MNDRNLLAISALTLAMTFSVAADAMSATISTEGNKPADIKAKCDEVGGTYMPPTKDSEGSYGCVNKKGHGVYCGGVKPYTDTCDTFFLGPRDAGKMVARLGGGRVVRRNKR